MELESCRIVNEPEASTEIEVSIITVNWNSVDYIQKCIESIIEHTHKITYEIIVIDGASYDGCGEMLKKYFPKVIFIQSETNDGFARANNRAYEASRGDCLLFLNPDTKILGPAIQTLHQTLMTQPSAGAVGCMLLNSDSSIQTSCILAIPTILNQMLDSEWLRRRFPLSTLWGMAPLFRNPEHVEEVAAISGACLLIRRAVFEEIGLFSTEYFMYAEDIDLCYKIKRAGYQNYYVPKALVTHFGGGSSNKVDNHFSIWMKRESIWRFFSKTRGSSYALGYRLGMVVSSIFRLMIFFPAIRLRQFFHSDSNKINSFDKWTVILKWGLNIGNYKYK